MDKDKNTIDTPAANRSASSDAVDHKNQVPLMYYRERFSTADPSALSAKCGLPYQSGGFCFSLLNHPMKAAWPSGEITYEETGAFSAKTSGEPIAPGESVVPPALPAVPPALQILLLRLLLEGVLVPPTGQMRSYREMPWGEVYLQQFTGRVIKRLAFAFGSKLSAFATACEKLGGRPTLGGDISYDLPFLPNLTIRLTLWEGDEEFPPSAQFLFSDNFAAAFTAEDMAVVGDIVINELKKSRPAVFP